MSDKVQPLAHEAISTCQIGCDQLLSALHPDAMQLLPPQHGGSNQLHDCCVNLIHLAFVGLGTEMHS